MTLSSSALELLLLLWTSYGGSTVSGCNCWVISLLCGALKGDDLCLYLDPSFADFWLSFLSCLFFLFLPVLIFFISLLSLFWLNNYLCSFFPFQWRSPRGGLWSGALQVQLVSVFFTACRQNGRSSNRVSVLAAWILSAHVYQFPLRQSCLVHYQS